MIDTLPRILVAERMIKRAKDKEDHLNYVLKEQEEARRDDESSWMDCYSGDDIERMTQEIADLRYAATFLDPGLKSSEPSSK